MQVPDLTPLIYAVIGGTIVAAVSLGFSTLRDWLKEREHNAKVKELIINELKDALKVLNQILAKKQRDEAITIDVNENDSFFNDIRLTVTAVPSFGALNTKQLMKLKQTLHTLNQYNTDLQFFKGHPKLIHVYVEPTETLVKEIQETLRLLK